MEFNPALLKFEPSIPPSKSIEAKKFKMWKLILIALLISLGSAGFIILLNHYG